MIRNYIILLLTFLFFFGIAKRAFSGGEMDIAPICDDLGSDVYRAKGWRPFTPPDNDLMPTLVRQGKVELLNGTGEAFTLLCRNPVYPEVTFKAVQRWYRRK